MKKPPEGGFFTFLLAGSAPGSNGVKPGLHGLT
jgi:hypothetical protein